MGVLRKKALRTMAVVLAIALTLFTTSSYSAVLAYASADTSTQDSSAQQSLPEGNNTAEDIDVLAENSSDDSVGIYLGDDLCWAGSDFTLSNASVKNDILAAGMNLSATDSVVPGSVRIAGYSIKVEHCDVGQSATLAGYKIAFEEGSAKAAALAGMSANFTGTVDSLRIACKDAYVNGIVNGDAEIVADNVTIGSDAVIDGTLHVTSGKEPTIEDGATIGNLEVDITEEATEDNSTEDSKASLVIAGIPIIGSILGAGIASVIGSIIWGILTFMAMALLCEWLGRRRTADALTTIRTRTGAHIGTGLIAALVAPIALIVLCCTGVGLPVAGALLCALLAITLVGGGFACASLAPLVFPHMGRWKRVILFSAIVGLCSAIPVVGTLITIAGFVYLLGYILQRIYLGLLNPPSAPVQPSEPIMPNGPMGSTEATEGYPNAVPQAVPQSSEGAFNETPSVTLENNTYTPTNQGPTQGN